MVLDGFSDVSAILRAGVYVLAYQGRVVSVGKSTSMYSRIYTHRNLWNQRRKGKQVPSWLPSSVKGMLFDAVYIQPCSLEALDGIEQEMIRRYQPKYNVLHNKKPEPVRVPLSVTLTAIIPSLASNQTTVRRI